MTKREVVVSDILSDLLEIDRLVTDSRISNEALGMRLRNTWAPSEAADEIKRLRGALELIAGSTADKLQAIQARQALPNIGPKTHGRS